MVKHVIHRQDRLNNDPIDWCDESGTLTPSTALDTALADITNVFSWTIHTCKWNHLKALAVIGLDGPTFIEKCDVILQNVRSVLAPGGRVTFIIPKQQPITNCGKMEQTDYKNCFYCQNENYVNWVFTYSNSSVSSRS